MKTFLGQEGERVPTENEKTNGLVLDIHRLLNEHFRKRKHSKSHVILSMLLAGHALELRTSTVQVAISFACFIFAIFIFGVHILHSCSVSFFTMNYFVIQ